MLYTLNQFIKKNIILRKLFSNEKFFEEKKVQNGLPSNLLSLITKIKLLNETKPSKCTQINRKQLNTVSKLTNAAVHVRHFRVRQAGTASNFGCFFSTILFNNRSTPWRWLVETTSQESVSSLRKFINLSVKRSCSL